MRNRRRYTVVYERDEFGVWVATIGGRPGGVHCVTQGRSIAQARARIREALSACLDDAAAAAQADLRERFKVELKVRTRIGRLARKRALAAKLQAETSQETRAAARVLTQDEGMSIRDAAELLDMSFQRVMQLLQDRPQPSPRRPAEVGGRRRRQPNRWGRSPRKRSSTR